MLSEFSKTRAETLNKFNFPEIKLPIGIKILWFDNLNSENIKERDNYTVHSHTFFEIHYVFSGKTSYKCNGEYIEIGKNKALIIPPGVQHTLADCDGELVKTSVGFSVDLKSISVDCFKINNFRIIEFDDEIANNVNYMLKIGENTDFFVPHILSGRILEIIYKTVKLMDIRLPDTEDKGADSRVTQAKEYIENNITEIIKIDDVAKECCLSSKQLGRIFKLHTGITVNEYIVNSKISYSKKLLIRNECSVKEIGYMLGFENESSFVSFFKRHCGITPGVFKKQYS